MKKLPSLIYKAVFFVFLTIAIVMIILVGMSYVPFIKERLAFHIYKTQDSTTISNKEFDFSFALNDKCTINTDVLNQISNRHYYLMGKIWCSNYAQPVFVSVGPYNQELDGQLLSSLPSVSGSGIFGGYFAESKHYLLVALSKDGTKMITLSAQEGNVNLFKQILDNLKSF